MKQRDLILTRRHFLILAGGISGAPFCPALSAESTLIAPQPYFAGVNRAVEAMANLGSPAEPADAQRIAALMRQNDSTAVDAAEQILLRYTLLNVLLGSDGKLKVTEGGASRTLIEQGWRVFLLRVDNSANHVDDLAVYVGSERYWGPGVGLMAAESKGAQIGRILDTIKTDALIKSMWLLPRLHQGVMDRYGQGTDVMPLSGVPVEYGIIQLFSRDQGHRVADINLYTLPRSKDGIGGVTRRAIAFDCLPSRVVTLRVLDTDGVGCVAALTIKDKRGNVYPPQAMRLAPDMSFQEHIYRANNETMRLADGQYTIESERGPEYLRGVQTVIIDDRNRRIDVRLQRWIDPSKWGWYSGDTHIHAGGCAHYEHPTEGVSPETIIRHVRGEALSIGDVLTWGPSWYYQKQFFTGHAQSPAAALEHSELQAANNTSLQPSVTARDSESVLRYDVEVSGFPSSHAGHLVLLRLKEQNYPGTRVIEDWPSWNLPILQWAKQQGAASGYAHCGSGMVVDSLELPNYEIPPMDGVGTQEAIIDVTHGAIDFLSGCDTNPVAELNAWYHMLNCGFQIAMIGETDWPCITDRRVGTGRSYVRLECRPVGDAGYESWIQGLKAGRLYCGDGRSHFLVFNVNGQSIGGADLTLNSPGDIHVEALVAARLQPEVTPETSPKREGAGWGWHLEWARIGTMRDVPLELIVNGIAVEKVALRADGAPRSIKFETPIARSSWVALRIMPSAHTHPVFVHVNGKPIRASKRSAKWCRACVDRVWEVKSPFIREGERPAAARAFDHARYTYERIMMECEVD